MTGLRNGVLVIGTVSLGVAIWATGAWRWSWWCADEVTSRRLGAVDRELDFIESVNADIDSLNRR
ncbi:MAG: hypothetical protein JSS74_10850 [Actinobacteria bacterium]|nr:hypothetical protein [Actinomycetota bacterium]